MAHFHLLGIAGTFMAGVATLAKALGHEVSGSDEAFQAPMGDVVRGLGCRLYEGYGATVDERPADCYLVGNAISRGNPLMESVLRSRRPYQSAVQWLAETVLHQRRVVAVAGTHGKTTTAALLTWLLECQGYSPGFLVGGVLPNFEASARLSPDSPWFVVEADEYDSAFFDKRPKFLHFRPHVVVVNNIEFDHADIYADVEAIVRQFHYLLRNLPDDGHLVARDGDVNVQAVLERQSCPVAVRRFGEWTTEGRDWRWQWRDGGMEVFLDGDRLCGLRPPLPGAVNRHNVLAAVAALAAVGGAVGRLGEGTFAEFRPPLKRLQKIFECGDVRCFVDFAHHPTAIRETLAALREAADGRRRIVAVFEPRSNSMKAGVFADRLAAAFAEADLVIATGRADWLRASLSDHAAALVVPTVDDTFERIRREAVAGDDLLIMSNGDYGGLPGRLRAAYAGDDATCA